MTLKDTIKEMEKYSKEEHEAVMTRLREEERRLQERMIETLEKRINFLSELNKQIDQTRKEWEEQRQWRKLRRR